MLLAIGTTAPTLAADAYVAGEKRRCLGIDELRGSWLVVAHGAHTADLRELAALEEAFAAGGAVIVATTPAEYHEVASAVAAEAPAVRFPILTDVEEARRLTMIVDPGGVIRHVGVRRGARETLATLETLIFQRSLLRAA